MLPNNQVPQPTQSFRRVCGIRMGVYLISEAEAYADVLSNIVDPPVPIDMKELNITPVGQNFIQLPGQAPFIIDVVGDPYCPSDFIMEAMRKGTSNKAPNFEDPGLMKAFYERIKFGMEVKYVSKYGWIHPDFRHLYYDDRKYDRVSINQGSPCLKRIDEHVHVDKADLPMCASLYFEDLPHDQQRNHPVNNVPRLVRRECGDFDYYGFTEPTVKAVRTYAWFFTGFITGIDVVYPDDVKKANQVADLLSGFGLNVPIKMKEF